MGRGTNKLSWLFMNAKRRRPVRRRPVRRTRTVSLIVNPLPEPEARLLVLPEPEARLLVLPEPEARLLVLPEPEAQLLKLPEPEARLLVCYPPGYLLLMDPLLTSLPFRLPYFYELALHAVVHLKSIGKCKNYYMTDRQVEAMRFSDEIRIRVWRCLNRVDGQNAVKFLKNEICKHGRWFSFMDCYAYVTFALDLYEEYFSKLVTFAVNESLSRSMTVKDCKLYGRNWIGIQLEEFINLAHEYGPIKKHNGALKFQVFERNGVFFLYQISMYVTRDQLPARRKGRLVTMVTLLQTPGEKDKVISLDEQVPTGSFVFVMGLLTSFMA